MPAKVLIADDHASVRHSIRSLLEGDGGYQVCCEAKDGLEAVRLAKSCEHDVVIIDLLMPNLNGFQVAKQISSSVPDVPIVLHTLYGGQAVEREAKKFGVDVVVPKVSSTNLKKVVENLLSSADCSRTAVPF
ncbi:MAG TPA: response regulator transcription factor [Terriglobales bacterium]|nr:response regulator transcription factor [Terriglobales bacterium]